MIRSFLAWFRRAAWSSWPRRLITIVSVLVAVSSWPLDDRQLLIVGTVYSTAMSAVLLAFAGRYATKRSNWRANPLGRALMYSQVMFALFGAQVSIGNWTTLIIHSEGYPLRLEIRYLLNFAILIVAVNMFRALIQIQREARNSRTEE